MKTIAVALTTQPLGIGGTFSELGRGTLKTHFLQKCFCLSPSVLSSSAGVPTRSPALPPVRERWGRQEGCGRAGFAAALPTTSQAGSGALTDPSVPRGVLVNGCGTSPARCALLCHRSPQRQSPPGRVAGQEVPESECQTSYTRMLPDPVVTLHARCLEALASKKRSQPEAFLKERVSGAPRWSERDQGCGRAVRTTGSRPGGRGPACPSSWS